MWRQRFATWKLYSGYDLLYAQLIRDITWTVPDVYRELAGGVTSMACGN